MTSLAFALMRYTFVVLLVAAGSTMALAVATPEAVVPVAQQRALPVPAQTGDGGLGDGGGNGSGGCTEPGCGAGNLPQPGGPVGNPGGSPGGNAPVPVGGGKGNTGAKTPVLGGGGGGGGGAAPAVASNSGGDGRDNAPQQRGSGGSDSGSSAPPAQGGGKRQTEVLYTHDEQDGKGSAGAGASSGRVQCSDGACVTMPFLPAWVVVLGATVLICVTFYVGMRLVGSRLRRWVE